jgi:hypothetical protein
VPAILLGARIDPLGLLHALQGIVDGFFDRTGISLEI